MRDAEDIERILKQVKTRLDARSHQTYNDILDGKCTILSIALLRRWLTEVGVNVFEKFPGRFNILEKQKDECEFV
jgi:hypothetical protein